MKKRLLMASMAAISILLVACGSNGTKETDSNDNSDTVKNGKIEIELTLDNMNDYIDFVSVESNEWIIVNKQYENDMVYIDDDFEIYYEVTSYITVEDAKQEKRSGISNTFTFSTIIESIDKPVITDISGTITLYKGGKAYYDSDKKQRIVEYGSNKKESRNDRTEYFNEYPY